MFLRCCWCTAIILLFLPLSLRAQREKNIWLFGDNAGIDFNAPAPANIPGGIISFFEGSAVVADRNTGALLFYTNGREVMNRKRLPMQGGSGLNGDYSSTQSALILPMPGDSQRYYIFTTDAAENDLINGLQYSIVDMRLDSGLGGVTLKNIPLIAPATEKLTGARGCDGRDYWAIAHQWGNNGFFAYRITSAGISPPVISYAGRGYKGFKDDARGYMKISPNGRKLAATGVNGTELFDFDAQTGVIANPIALSQTNGYGLSFSPDNSLLYVSEFSGRINQYDITSNDAATINASRFMLSASTPAGNFGALQLAPDGRIYAARDGLASLDVINNPNGRGAGAAYQAAGYNLGGRNGLPGLPNMIHGDAGAAPTIHIDSSRTICPGESTRLNASGGAVYRWSPADGLSCADCPSPTASPVATTTYIVNVYGDADCPAIDSLTVFVRPARAIDAGEDRTICLGDSATLTATEGTAYQWSPAEGLSCASCRSPRASPATTTIYHLVVTDSAGCSAADSVRITVAPAFTADAGKDASICRGEAIPLHASDGAAWLWTPASGLSCADCREPIASPSTTTTYHVTITSPGGCAAADSVTVTVTSLPLVDAGRDTTICAGGKAQLAASDGAAWRWSPADGLSCADCREPIASPPATTTYHLIVIGVGGCVGEDSITVTVAAPPLADAGRDTTICAGTAVALHAGGGSGYRWSPADGLSCTDCAAPIAAPSATTTYILTAIGAAGCAAADSITITLITPPPIDAGPDTSICVGGSAALHASGGAGYRWSPAEGLSCTDCPDPIARLSRTMTYTVSAAGITGCPSIDSVRIILLPRGIIHVRIPRDLHLLPGDSIDVPIIIDDPTAISAGDEYTIRLAYRPGMIRVREPITDGTASEGWKVERRDDTIGGVTLRLTRPAGVATTIGDTLLKIRMQGFVGDSIASEIPFTLDPGPLPCATIETIPGLLRLDSICGLSHRLIQPITGEYALKQNIPNPFSPSTTIEFSLALDGPTRLTVVNEHGETVATLLDGMMMPGSYAITWDASAIPSGLYYCRLVSGDWTATTVMMLVR